MAYAIMRCKKLVTLGSVVGALQHCYRDRETPNADQERTPDNEHHSATSTDEAMGRLRAQLPEKRRKDAVLAVEYVMTASPEWWEKATPAQQAEFFEHSKRWLADKYGANRIITASVHRDEASPHLSAFVVPITRDGRLSAKEFIGNRTMMRNDQTSFADAVRGLGLERGIEGSRATHQSIKAYYAAIDKGHPEVTISPEAVTPKVWKEGFLKKAVETPQGVADRLTSDVRAVYAPALTEAGTARQERRRAEEMRKTAEAKAKELAKAKSRADQFDNAFKGLTKAQFTKMAEQITQWRAENARAAELVKAQQVAKAPPRQVISPPKKQRSGPQR